MADKIDLQTIRLDPVISAAIRSGRYRVISMLTGISSGIEPAGPDSYIRRYSVAEGTPDTLGLPGVAATDEA